MTREKIRVPDWLKGRTGAGTGRGTNKVMVRVDFKRMFEEHPDLTAMEVAKVMGYGRNGVIMAMTRGTVKPSAFEKLVAEYPYAYKYAEGYEHMTANKEN